MALVAVIVFFATAAYSAEKMGWEDCVSRTAKNNSDIRASQEQLSSSENLAKGAYSGFLPQISAGANATRGNNSVLPGVGDVPNVTNASLALTQNLFNGFYDASLVDQNAANRDAARATLNAAKVQVSYSLKTAFAAYRYAQKYLQLSEQIIKRRTENAELVELHYEGGVENLGSVMLSKAFVGQAKYDKTVAKYSIDVSHDDLAKVMGIDADHKFEISGDAPISEPGNEPDLKKIVLTTPAHIKSVAEEKSKQAGVPLARSQFFPNLGLTGTLSARGNDDFPNATKNSLMLSVSLPVFAGGNDYYNLKSAAAQYAASSYSRESVDQKLIPQLRLAFASYMEAVEKLKVDKAFLEAATVRAEIARSKYNNGLLSFEDWDIIENDLISKQKVYLQSERDRTVAEAAWELASGKGVIP